MMWRGLFIALGMSLCILGAEMLVVDRLIIVDPADRPAASGYSELSSFTVATPQKIFVPPEWAPWGFLSGGVLTVLYTASLRNS